jgi:hypothetical protein
MPSVDEQPSPPKSVKRKKKFVCVTSAAGNSETCRRTSAWLVEWNLSDLHEPVWREDVEKEVEYLGEGCRTLSVYYHRAQTQGAPAALLDEIAEAYRGLESVKVRLESIRLCFMEEPKNQR